MSEASSERIDAIAAERARLTSQLLSERDSLTEALGRVNHELVRIGHENRVANRKCLRLDHDGWPTGQSGRIVDALIEEPGLRMSELMMEAGIMAAAAGYRNLYRLERLGWVRRAVLGEQGCPYVWYPTDMAKRIKVTQ